MDSGKKGNKKIRFSCLAPVFSFLQSNTFEAENNFLIKIYTLFDVFFKYFTATYLRTYAFYIHRMLVFYAIIKFNDTLTTQDQ